MYILLPDAFKKAYKSLIEFVKEKMKNNQIKDTVSFFKSLCKMTYICCSYNFWFEDYYSSTITIIYTKLSKFVEALVLAYMTSLWCSFLTQRNLSADQEHYMRILAACHLIGYVVYINCVYYRQEFQELMYTLTVRLKEMFNDEECDRMMVKTGTRCLWGLIFLCSLTFLNLGLDSGVQALTSNATFVTVIPAWPDVEDRRPVAAVARVIYYIFFWIFAIRVLPVYLITICIIISLSHQFKILCKYFENLSDIFTGSGNQAEKEKRYENAFKVGIKMHSITLWCIQQTQLTCGVAYSVQVIYNVCVIMMLMIQMMHVERTLVTVMLVVLMFGSVLTSTGLFMWNAGDITVEAARLPNAMFYSGWHNCHLSSVSTRKLVTIAMTQAQQRVSVKALGLIELSYESFVTIVKSSYSLFSVIY